MSDFVTKKCICGELYCTTLIIDLRVIDLVSSPVWWEAETNDYCSTLLKRNLQLKHTEFLLKLTVIMLCRKQHAEFGLDTSKVIILMLKIKNTLAHRKKFKDEELEALLHEDSCQLQAELPESLEVGHTTVSKHLKALGMVQKQGHWVPYELKPRDVERRLVTCEQLLQQQEKKRFLASYRDRR